MAETGPTGCQTWGVVKTQWLTIWSARHFGKQNRDAVKNGQFQQQLPKKKFWSFCWLPWCFRMLEYTFLSLSVDSPNKTTCKSYPWPPGLHGLRKFLQRLKKLLHHRHRIFMSSRPRPMTNSANTSGEKKKTRLFRAQMFFVSKCKVAFLQVCRKGFGCLSCHLAGTTWVDLYVVDWYGLIFLLFPIFIHDGFKRLEQFKFLLFPDVGSSVGSLLRAMLLP